ncbi:hypothetical protein [Paraburkholderia hospita]|uniref:hypothetical protein n=1 Tax=Paraburkholderia hospita TaxID=169430 RepID=UPI001FC7D416|nr:hypothetical protein [Paraburkholderia hospita]
MADSGSLTGSGPSPAGDFSLVFDEPLACGDGLQRKQTFTMHRRMACRDASQSHCVVSLRNVWPYSLPQRSISLRQQIIQRVVLQIVQLTVSYSQLIDQLRHIPSSEGRAGRRYPKLGRLRGTVRPRFGERTVLPCAGGVSKEAR